MGVIMSKEYRIYFGKKFYKNSQGYWVCTTQPIPWAHRWVWINHNGEIPKGLDIHHIDEDKSNNEIINLQLVNRSDHLKIHWEDPEARRKRREFLTQIRPLAHKYLRSVKGRKRQSEDAKIGWTKRKELFIICKECGKQRITKISWTIFCSDACDKKWRRKQKMYFIEEICQICNKLFSKCRFSPQKFCSISCGAKNSANNRKKRVD
jgi:hypothetical protein